MTLTRRSLALASVAILPLAACQGTTPPSPAQTATDVAAGVAAATAIKGIATSLEGACTGLTAPEVTACTSAIEAGIGTLNSTASSLSAASGSPQISSAAATVQNVLNTIAPWITDIAELAPLLALVQNDYYKGEPYTFLWSTGTNVKESFVFYALAETKAKAARLDARHRALMASHLHGLAAALAKAKAAEAK